MTTLNLATNNVTAFTVTSSIIKEKDTPFSLFKFSVYLLNGDLVEFSSLSAGIKLVGTSTLNGKRVAVKAALKEAQWYSEFNSLLSRNDNFSQKLHNSFFYKEDGKLKFLEQESCELVQDVQSSNVSAEFEEKLYKTLQGYKYDNLSMGSVDKLLKTFWIVERQSLNTEEYPIYHSMIVSIRSECLSFLESKPQFKGNIKKGIVLNIFYGLSNKYRGKYKELTIQNKVQYSYNLFLERLFGYLNFRTKEQYSLNEYREMVRNFILREKNFILSVEGLRDHVDLIYKTIFHHVPLCDGKVLKTEAIIFIKESFTPAP